MRRAIAFVVALSFSCLALVASGGAAGESARRQSRESPHGEWFFVAILRSDGVLIPFATYWQGFWLTPWPAPQGYPPETNTVANLAEAWFTQYDALTPVWYANGPSVGRPLRLRAARAVEVENHCGKNWGLQTDYAGERYKPNEHHRNVGVAASAPVEIISPVELDARARTVAPVVALIRRRFEQDERDWLARPDFGWRAKLFPAAATRERRAPEIRTLFRATARDGRRLYYFEAERRYPKPRGAHDASCESVSAMSGMLMQAGGGAPRLVEREFALSDCDGKEIDSRRPLGLVRDGRREFLIMEEHGYESEGYTVLEILGQTFRRLRRVEGGGC